MRIQFRASMSLVLCISVAVAAPSQRAIAPSDCVEVRYLLTDNNSEQSSVQINKDGTRVAYLVKSPNLKRNRNDVELYTNDLPAKASQPATLIMSGDISQMNWLANGKQVMLLVNQNGRQSIEAVDVVTRRRQMLVSPSTGITDYATDNTGDTIVYAARPALSISSPQEEQAAESGYLIPFEDPGHAQIPERELFLSRRTKKGWTKPTPIVLRSLFTGELLPQLMVQDALFYISLSPDGRLVLIRYIDQAKDIPGIWRNSPFVKYSMDSGFVGTVLLALYDLGSGKTTFPLKTPWTSSVPLWSSDSRSFVVMAHAPVGSGLEEDEIRNHLAEHSSGGSLYRVELDTGRIDQVVPHARITDPFRPPLAWTNDDSFLIATSPDTISRFSHHGEVWREESALRIPLTKVNFRGVAVRENYVVGEFNDAATPPEIFSWHQGQDRVEILSALNPQFASLTLAPAKELSWATPAGYKVKGFLFLPPSYIEGKRYPLVVQTKPYDGWFACDEGAGHFPSFAPQPLANAGIMYLGISDVADASQRIEDYFPTGLPGRHGIGGVAEAALNMEIYDSAVEALAERGLIDETNVGLIGFSRTAWYVEYALSHSKIPYRAATLADGVHYSLGEYWLLRNVGTRRAWDSMYGGPPYGATLANWLKYSPSFTVDRIHTPILMEEMGYGRSYANEALIPLNLAPHFELFTALNRLDKPVELYYYPSEGHEPDLPRARLGTLQRNLDWYRFWLQGYVDTRPESAGQYIRWSKLLEMQTVAGHPSSVAQEPRESPLQKPN
jgi:dipeptidyl aminopeptidase/acylaminoacyl peptidase